MLNQLPPSQRQEALRALEQMRTAQEELGIAASLYGIGNILGYQGRLGAALESHREAMETLEASGENSFWRVVVTARYAGAENQRWRPNWSGCTGCPVVIRHSMPARTARR